MIARRAQQTYRTRSRNQSEAEAGPGAGLCSPDEPSGRGGQELRVHPGTGVLDLEARNGSARLVDEARAVDAHLQR